MTDNSKKKPIDCQAFFCGGQRMLPPQKFTCQAFNPQKQIPGMNLKKIIFKTLGTLVLTSAKGALLALAVTGVTVQAQTTNPASSSSVTNAPSVSPPAVTASTNAAPAVTPSPDTDPWPPDRAWAWFKSQPLPIGCNYIPANSISYTEMWMGYDFDPKLIDDELMLAQDIGFNSVRVVLSYVVWEAEPDAFKQRFEKFLDVCHQHNIKVMVCFFDDCEFGPIQDPVFGPQPGVVVGWYANGWTPSPGRQRAHDPQMLPKLEQYVKDVMMAHRDDPRILCWDLYNEAGNTGLGDASLPLLKAVFGWAREVNPTQPITSCIWSGQLWNIDNFIKTHSDIISFHNYSPAAGLRGEIHDLKGLGRPLICSEWMNRNADSKVATCLPVLVEERVGAFNWGLVNGKTQTDLNWGHRPGQPPPPLWQHDLFHNDHTPYDQNELDLFHKAIQDAQLNEQ
jgi:hypothetical protein